MSWRVDSLSLSGRGTPPHCHNQVERTLWQLRSIVIKDYNGVLENQSHRQNHREQRASPPSHPSVSDDRRTLATANTDRASSDELRENMSGQDSRARANSSIVICIWHEKGKA